MHFTQGKYASINICCFFRVWLMEHSFISISRCPGFVCIDPWDDKDFILNLFVNFCKTRNIVAYSVFITGGTRSYHKNKFVCFSRNNVLKFRITFVFNSCEMAGKRHDIPDFIGCWNILFVYETHKISAPFLEFFDCIFSLVTLCKCVNNILQ